MSVSSPRAIEAPASPPGAGAADPDDLVDADNEVVCGSALVALWHCRFTSGMLERGSAALIYFIGLSSR
jgi:hypothetical protein